MQHSAGSSSSGYNAPINLSMDGPDGPDYGRRQRRRDGARPRTSNGGAYPHPVHTVPDWQCLMFSQCRREKILEAMNHSWSKYAFPECNDTLFGEGFETILAKKVEKDTALSKAAFITKRGHKDGDSKESHKDRVFSREPFCKVRRQEGQEFIHVQQGGGDIIQRYQFQRQDQKSLYGRNQLQTTTPTSKVLEMLNRS